MIRRTKRDADEPRGQVGRLYYHIRLDYVRCFPLSVELDVREFVAMCVRRNLKIEMPFLSHGYIILKAVETL